MNRKVFGILVGITLFFSGILLGYFAGRNVSGPQILVQAGVSAGPTIVTQPTAEETLNSHEVSFPININTATTEMLVQLPGIGEILAQRIVAYRQSFGEFESIEELMEVDGISENRFNSLLGLVSISD